MTIKVDPISFGSVTYCRANPGREASDVREFTGGSEVRTITTAIPPVPAYFTVSFSIHWTDPDGPAPSPGHMHVAVNVPAASPDMGYRQVEDEAALSLSRRLRALADALDRQLEAQQQEAD
jgi:hypothetical protein